MKTLKITSVILIALLMASCSPSREKMAKQIAEKEKNLVVAGNPVPDKTKTLEIIEMYKKYADTYPKDSLAPIYLYKAADLSMNFGQNEDAIKLLDRVIKDYQDFKKLPETYFLKAFIYDNNIKNIVKARAAYQDFLQKYPKSDLANDATLSLQNLGKTPEEIVKGFEVKAKQKADSAAAATVAKKK